MLRTGFHGRFGLQAAGVRFFDSQALKRTAASCSASMRSARFLSRVKTSVIPFSSNPDSNAARCLARAERLLLAIAILPS